ncbi:MAG: hypothetical protein IJS91_04990 [Bacteroidales bacterium]|nr:hypothetical protein [Bacteroidales bacterium]
MNRWLFFASTLLFLACSCHQQDNPQKSEAETAEFLSDFEFLTRIDLSKENLFKEGDLYGDWKITTVFQEIYIDGTLNSSTDVTSGLTSSLITLRGDHTAGNNKTWLYAYNYLFIKNGSAYSYWEVANLESDFLRLKKEENPVGSDSFIPYYKDKSGEHRFSVFELHPN